MLPILIPKIGGEVIIGFKATGAENPLITVGWRLFVMIWFIANGTVFGRLGTMMLGPKFMGRLGLPLTVGIGYALIGLRT